MKRFSREGAKTRRGDEGLTRGRGERGALVVSREGGKIAKAEGLDGLVTKIGELIRQARQQALRAVDVVQVRTSWEVGRHLVEFEQGGALRTEYGTKLLGRLAARLTGEFGRGFDASNLYKMSQFYRLFPKLDALRPELSWTHFRLLLRVEDADARMWYMNEAAGQNWGTRALERQIGTLYYERMLSSKDRKPLRTEAARNVAALNADPREFVRDPVMREQRLLEEGSREGAKAQRSESGTP